MAFDAFLKIDGIPGESTDAAHKDYIEILSYSHGLSQPASNTASSVGGASAERVSFGAFSITKLVDKATPKLFDAACTGRHIKEVILEVNRAGGEKTQFLKIRMEQVLISSYQHDGGGDFPTESISFTPGKFHISYTQQKRGDGAPSGNIAAGWDLTTNKSYA